MNINIERHNKGIDDHFRDATKMVLEFNPIEFDGFGRAGR
jgi:hypothetical protein